MRYEPNALPSVAEAQIIISAIGPVDICFSSTTERIERIWKEIDKYFKCKKANDYKKALYQCFLACERIPRNLKKDGKPYTIRHVTNIPTNLDIEGKRVFRTIRIFYDAMRYRFRNVNDKK